MMKQAIKALFEQTKSEIVSLNLDIDQTNFVEIMREFVRDYLAEGNIELAFEASKFTRNPEDNRLVLEASRKITPIRNHSDSEGFQKFTDQKSLLFQILLSTGTEKDLRDAARLLERKRGTSEKEAMSGVIKIYSQLNDANALLRFGNELAEIYFTAATNKERVDVFLNPPLALEALKAAKKIKGREADKALIEFGEKLFEVDKKWYLSRSESGFFSTPIPEAIQAIEFVGTKWALKRAAEMYLSINKPALAACCFNKIGDDTRTIEAIELVAQDGKLLESVRLRANLIKQPISVQELENLFETLTRISKKNFQETVSNYLETHSNDDPFPKGYTFYVTRTDVGSWNELETVNSMASRTDTDSESKPSTAKELYMTSNAPVITKIYRALLKHLLIGSILSAIKMEVDGRCPNRQRKYEHAFDAAFLTLEHVFAADEYSLFEIDPNFKNDSDMSAFFRKLKKFKDEELETMEEAGIPGYMANHCPESHNFLREKSPRLQKYVRRVYQKITNDIRNLLTQMK